MERKTIKQHGFKNGEIVRIYSHGNAKGPLGREYVSTLRTVARMGIFVTEADGSETWIGGTATKFWAEKSE